MPFVSGEDLSEYKGQQAKQIQNEVGYGDSLDKLRQASQWSQEQADSNAGQRNDLQTSLQDKLGALDKLGNIQTSQPDQAVEATGVSPTPAKPGESAPTQSGASAVPVSPTSPVTAPLESNQPQPQPAGDPLAGLKDLTSNIQQKLSQLGTRTQPVQTPIQAPTVSTGPQSGAPQVPSDLDKVVPDNTSREAFIQSMYGLAKAWEQKTGIPAEYFLAANGSESNWGRAPGNELFGIKNRPGNATTGPLATWEFGQGAIKDSFSAYPSANAAYADFIDLISHGRYAPAWEQFQKDRDPAKLFRNINAAGYATDPEWGNHISQIAASIKAPAGGYQVPQTSQAGGGTSQEVMNKAQPFMGMKYVWGGKDPQTGFDCSGFAGYETTGQAESTRTLYAKSTPISANDAQPGDLVFYHMQGSSGPADEHVAVYKGDGQVVQAGGLQPNVNVASANQFSAPGWQPEFRRVSGTPTIAKSVTALPGNEQPNQSNIPNVTGQGATQTGDIGLGAAWSNVQNKLNDLRDLAGSAVGNIGQAGEKALMEGPTGNLVNEFTKYSGVGGRPDLGQMSPEDQYVYGRSLASTMPGGLSMGGASGVFGREVAGLEEPLAQEAEQGLGSIEQGIGSAESGIQSGITGFEDTAASAGTYVAGLAGNVADKVMQAFGSLPNPQETTSPALQTVNRAVVGPQQGPQPNPPTSPYPFQSNTAPVPKSPTDITGPFTAESQPTTPGSPLSKAVAGQPLGPFEQLALPDQLAHGVNPLRDVPVLGPIIDNLLQPQNAAFMGGPKAIGAVAGIAGAAGAQDLAKRLIDPKDPNREIKATVIGLIAGLAAQTGVDARKPAELAAKALDNSTAVNAARNMLRPDDFNPPGPIERVRPTNETGFQPDLNPTGPISPEPATIPENIRNLHTPVGEQQVSAEADAVRGQQGGTDSVRDMVRAVRQTGLPDEQIEVALRDMGIPDATIQDALKPAQEAAQTTGPTVGTLGARIGNAVRGRQRGQVAIGSDADAQDAVDATLQSGGTTIDARTLKQVTPMQGYVVGLQGGLEVDQRELTPDLIRRFAQQSGTDTIGTWIDSDTGKVALDPVRIVDDYQEARNLGIEHRQKAIWDAAASHEITLPTPKPEQEPVQYDRYYHGTGSDFEKPSGKSFSNNTWPLPGYFLTSSPEVAGGRVAEGGEPRTEVIRAAQNQGRTDLLEAGIKPRKPGEVVEPGYAQNRSPAESDLAEANRLEQSLQSATPEYRANNQDWIQKQIDQLRGTAGPNVRVVNVPNNMNLLDIDKPAEPELVTGIANALGRKFGDQERQMFLEDLPQDMTGGELVQNLRVSLAGNEKIPSNADGRAAASILHDLGYDGIKYNGGRFNPMTDDAGKPVEHQAIAIFPKSLPKLQNAISGRQEGRFSLGTEAPDVPSMMRQVGARSVSDLTAEHIRQLPGMKDTTRDGSDLMAAVRAGLPFAKWYQDFASGVQNLVGKGNLREALTAMALTSPNTSVPLNAGATLSLMRAARQVEQEQLWNPDRTLALLRQSKNITQFANKGIGEIDATGRIVTPGADPTLSRMWDIVHNEDGAAVTRHSLGAYVSGLLTGKIETQGNAKIGSFFSNLLSAAANITDPRVTVDVWMGRLFSNNQKAIEAAQGGNGDWYRSAEALVSQAAKENNLNPYEAQAAAWSAVRFLMSPYASDRPQQIVDIANAVSRGDISLGEGIQRANELGFYRDLLKDAVTWSRENNLPQSMYETYQHPSFQRIVSNARNARVNFTDQAPAFSSPNMSLNFAQDWHRQVGAIGVPGEDRHGVLSNMFANSDPNRGAMPLSHFESATGAITGGYAGYQSGDPNESPQERAIRTGIGAMGGGLLGYTIGKGVENLATSPKTVDAALYAPTELNAGLTPQAVAKAAQGPIRAAANLFSPASNMAPDIQKAIANYDGILQSIMKSSPASMGFTGPNATQQLNQYAHQQAREFFLDDMKFSSGAVQKSFTTNITPGQQVTPGIGQGATGAMTKLNVQHQMVPPPGPDWVSGSRVNAPGVQQELAGFWISPEAKRAIETTLGEGPMSSNPANQFQTPIIGGIARAAGQAKQTILNTPFHGLQMELQMGRLNLASGRPQDIAGQWARSSLNAADLTGKSFNNWLNDPNTQNILQRALRANMTFGTGESADLINTLKGSAVRGAISGTTFGGATYGKEKSSGVDEDTARVDALRNGLLGFAIGGPIGSVVGPAIFNRQIPTLKIMSFDMLTNKVGMKDRDAAELINATFGGQNLVRIARQNFVTDTLRAITFAPDWWEGIARTIGRTPQGFMDIAKGQGTTTSAMSAKMTAIGAASAIIGLQAMQMLLTGHTTEQNANGFKWQLEIPHSILAEHVPGVPADTHNGQMDHFDILGYWRPVLELATQQVAPKDFVASRLSTPVAMGMAGAINEDYRGKPIVPPGTSGPEAAGDIAGYVGGELQPYGAQGIVKSGGIAGPLGAAASWATGFRATSETPGQEALKEYFSQKPVRDQQVATWIKTQPEYQRATTAERSVMLREAQQKADQQLREQVGTEPADFGQPQKYIGVTDRHQEQAISDAKQRVEAHKQNPRGSPVPSAQEQQLARHVETPQYKQWAKTRSKSQDTLISNLQTALSGSSFKAP